MSMYLVSDEELNKIIRLRRLDVIQVVSDLQEQNPDVALQEILTAAHNFFVAQNITYDYLADYASEEIAYGLIEAEIEEVIEEEEAAETETEPEAVEEEEAPVSELDGADVVAYEPEPQNLDPMSDETITVVDDTVNLIEDDEPSLNITYEEQAPVDGDGVSESVPAEEAEAAPVTDLAVPADNPIDLEKANAERGNRISLRALQRELRQIDKA